MHTAIDLMGQKGAVQFLGPQGLAAQFGQGTVLNAVAAGRDDDDLDRLSRPAMGGDQGGCRHLGLGQSKRGSARADAKGCGQVGCASGHMRLALAARHSRGK